MVEFAEKSAISLKGYRTLTAAKGTLGLITLNNDVFICVVTGSAEAATVRPGETVQKIFAVEFYCLNRPDYDHGMNSGYEPNPYPNQIFSTDDTNHGGHDQAENFSESPFAALKKLLSSGHFYYSLNFDLTRRLQDRADDSDTVDISSLDEGLLWNSYMINPLLSFRSRLSAPERRALDRSGMLTSVIRGFAQTLTIPPTSSPIRRKTSNYPANLTVISRLSSRRAGTRFNSRGLDDAGNVANFVETETIFWSPTGICFSYVQVRGSLPIFWESTSSLLPGQQKIQITRSPEATQMSFDRHFESLEKDYGAVHIVNLLSSLKAGEAELTERYNLHIRRSPLRRSEDGDSGSHDLLRDTEFDFHEHARAAGGFDGAKQVRPLIENSAEGFVYFLMEETEEDAMEAGQRRIIKRPLVVMQQGGVFRTNCLDCLDRTNVVQGLISQMAFELFLDHRGENPRANSVFWLRHRSLWADNGDTLSKIYAGTGALKSSFTRHGKMSLGGLVSDVRKSATRLYVNQFEDKGRQNTVDLLLGRLVGQNEVDLFDPVNDWVVEQLARKRDEYESTETVKVWVGTYNLNGKSMTDIGELAKWLDIRKREGHAVVVVGFQEIVELSPQQIMSTDVGRRTVWEAAVKECLNGSAEKRGRERNQDDYVLLRSGQLVGAALMIFVKVSALSKISNVEGAIKKTGMSGIAGNKGAVAIRMDIEGTSACFVTAHLAAGFGNYDERNRDYQTITSGLRFQRDRRIDDHDIVTWLGDFNYRIGLTYDKARSLVSIAQRGRNTDGTFTSEAEDAIGKLYENDQLNIQMVVGHCFQFYREGRVKFLPTYKFDLGKDEYDTSEKARIPAWTDRILWRIKPGTSGMKQVEYTSVQGVKFSDHRPVRASFEMYVKRTDEAKKNALMSKLYAKRLKELNSVSRARTHSDDELSLSPGAELEGELDEDEAEDLMGYQSIQEGLPPASSDRKRWWQDNDRPVRSTVGPPRTGLVLNDGRHGNPWKDDGEDEWVEVEKLAASARNGNTASPKPQPPPPRRAVARKAVTPGSGEPKASEDASGMELRNVNTPPPPPSRRSVMLDRAASITSTTTTASMMTAKTGQSDTKSPPPQKPAKPIFLRSSSTLVTTPQSDAEAMSTPRKTSGIGLVESPGTDKPPPLPKRTATSDTQSGTVTPDSVAANRGTPPPVQPRGVARLQNAPRESSVSTINSTRSGSSAASNEGVHRLSLPSRGREQDTDLMDRGNEEKLDKWKPLTPR